MTRLPRASPHFHALIMAGGRGERFWPWSRLARPKQLLRLLGTHTMIETTVARLRGLLPRDRIWIVTNAEQARAMRRLMPSFPKSNFIVEPVGRDSAGAVMLGCATIAARDPKAVMALLASDHVIHDTRGYLRVLRSCFETAAREPVLMTLGIEPRGPSSAYGYIEQGAACGRSAGTRFFRVRRFLEKPDAATARRLVKSPRYSWNAGMFVWSAAAIREAFERHSPVHAAGWRAVQADARRYLASGFLKLPRISIDYAVMEKARSIVVARGKFDWDDIGSWTALASHLKRDREGNAVRGNALLHDSRNCLVIGGKKTIAVLGAEDLVIVETEDATLVCHRDAAGRVKELVGRLPESLK